MDIKKLKDKNNVRGLIRALRQIEYQSAAIKALIEINSVDGLLEGLCYKETRLEASNALKAIESTKVPSRIMRLVEKNKIDFEFAISLLIEIGGKDTALVLEEKLRSGAKVPKGLTDEVYFERVIFALGEIGRKEATQSLIDLLEHQISTIKLAKRGNWGIDKYTIPALEALRKIRDIAAAPYIAKIAEESSKTTLQAKYYKSNYYEREIKPDLALVAVQALVEIRDPEVLLYYTKLLNGHSSERKEDPDNYNYAPIEIYNQRKQLLRESLKAFDADAVKYLSQLCDAKRGCFQWAIPTLTDIDQSAGIDLLQTLLADTDEDWSENYEILKTISNTYKVLNNAETLEEVTIDCIIELVSVSSWEVQQGAVKLINQFKVSKGKPVLIELLKSYDQLLGYTAQQAIRSMVTSDDAPIIRSLLNDSKIRHEIIILLGIIADYQSVQYLIEQLQYGDDRVRPACAYSLGIMQWQGAIPNLVDTLANDPLPEARAQAAQALGNIGDSKTIEYIANAVRDPYPIVREAASTAIQKIQLRQSVHMNKLKDNDALPSNDDYDDDYDEDDDFETASSFSYRDEDGEIDWDDLPDWADHGGEDWY